MNFNPGDICYLFYEINGPEEFLEDEGDLSPCPCVVIRLETGDLVAVPLNDAESEQPGDAKYFHRTRYYPLDPGTSGSPRVYRTFAASLVAAAEREEEYARQCLAAAEKLRAWAARHTPPA